MTDEPLDDGPADTYSTGSFRGQCLFCRAQVPLTREHTWPAWLRDALEPRGPFKADVAGRQWKTPSVDVTVRLVCGDCNNGWLSQIETATLPILRPMVTGEVTPAHPVLPDEAQHEPTRQGRMIPAGEFWAFHRHRRPVGNQFVFLAAYSGHRWAARSWRQPLYRTSREGNPSEHPVGYTATLLAGRALFRIVRCEPAGTPMWIDGSVTATSVRLWPPTTEPQRWPPPLLVNDEAVDAFGTATGTA
jgi:hypothetical protein